jgi:NAD(P)-dependent dehydrogenase (short-subunit alcohol dehydrogenase family)
MMKSNLSGKTIVITGGSSGIGEAAARALSDMQAKVIITGRSERTEKLAKEIGCDYFIVDYAKFSSVVSFAEKLLEKYPQIDILANNVGGVIDDRIVTKDGHEMTFQVNHLASFLGWANDLADNGLSGFYSRPGFHDYTPGYLYVLLLVGTIGRASGARS